MFDPKFLDYICINEVEFSLDHIKKEDVTLSGLRDNYDRACAHFKSYRPENHPAASVKSENSIITNDDKYFNNSRGFLDKKDNLPSSVEVRYYHPNQSEENAKQKPTMILFFHGGGFVLGDLESHHDICQELCHNTNLMLAAVNYRRCPEYRFPCPIIDALLCYQYFVDQGYQIILVGDSAGATLCALIAQHYHSRTDKPLKQVLIYPWLGGGWLTLPSFKSLADAPLLSAKNILFFIDQSFDQPYSMDNRIHVPLLSEDFTGYPPTYSFPASHDPLRDDGEEYCKRVNAHNPNHAHNITTEGLAHGWLRARHISPVASKYFDQICDAIKHKPL